MCGIAGIAGSKLNFDSSNIVEKMSLEVSHRGPDGAGYRVYRKECCYCTSSISNCRPN